MRIYENFEINDNNNRTITIGDFDGVHIGHTKLIEKTIDISQKTGTLSCALTFKFNTANIMSNKIKYLCTVQEKIILFEQTGIDELYIIEFNEDIRKKTSLDFIQNVLVDRLNVKNLVLGDDAKLGSDRLSIDSIKKVCDSIGVNLYCLSQIQYNNKRITSSYIRSMIIDGVVGDELREFLGRDYSFVGEVVHGNSFGKILGFPTANIVIDSSLVVPKYGVYYATCQIDDKIFNAGINIGDKPSVDNSYFGLEAFLLDFDDDIYGKKIKINLKKFIRPEEKFDSIEKLKEQISKDIENIRKLL